MTSFTLLNRTSHRCAWARCVDVDAAARATGGDAQAALPQVGADLAGRATRSMGGAASLSRRFSSGWSVTSGSPISTCRFEDGQLSLRFHGLWTETTMWEIYALSIIDELKTRASLKQLSEFELDILVCAGQDPAVGKDGAAARRSAAERKRLWHAAAA